MKRSIITALLGASLLIPASVEAQRGRVDRLARAATPQSARLADCRAPSDGRAYVCSSPASRTVYRYAGPPRPVAARAWVRPAWRHADVHVGWRGARRGEVGARWLRDVLGARTLRDVRAHGRRAGLHGPVRGHWTDGRRGASVLVLTMRNQVVARLVDRDFDGRVDVFLLRNFRRW
jgi:hypothetical protein